DPQLRQRRSPRSAGLCLLVFVVGEDEIAAAAVDLKSQAELLLRHRRALNVPTGSAAAPGRIPRGVLIWLLGLPQREIHRIALALRALHPLSLIHLAHSLMGDLAVLRVRRDREVDVSVHLIGV